MKTEIIIFNILVLIGFGCIQNVFAQEIFFDTENKVIPTDSEFVVDVFLNTEKQKINTIEGNVVFDDRLLEVQEIRQGNSSVHFWIDPPRAEKGNIYFAGMTPGAMTGDRVLLFSVVYRSKGEGTSVLRLNNGLLFKNDGQGTSVKASSKFLSLSFDASLAKGEPISALVDNNPPGDFLPFISKSELIFDGKYFLVFATQDKGSGVDYFEVKEGVFSKFTKQESPYVLKSQNPDKIISIKVVDRSGNERVVVINKKYKFKVYIYSIIIVIILYWFFRKKYEKKDSTNNS